MKRREEFDSYINTLRKASLVKCYDASGRFVGAAIVIPFCVLTSLYKVVLREAPKA